LIKVNILEIHEFRGIKSLTLDLQGKNFAVCGQNGTGKSGVVDALEFGLTGNIARLSGRGTGGISLKSHGPHVDSRTHPELARVRLAVSIPSLSKEVVIERCVKDASKPKITPSDPDILAVLAEVAAHPEFALSRREIIRFILTEPGTRAKQVTALLKLDKLEAIRACLLKIKNAEDRAKRQAEAMRQDAASKLQSALGTATITASELLNAANALRASLVLPAIPTLTADTNLKSGISSGTSSLGKAGIAKSVAQADVLAATNLEAIRNGEELSHSTDAVLSKIAELIADEGHANAAQKESLLRSALELFDGTACPVCETPWNEAEFRTFVDARIQSLDQFSKEREALEELIRPVAEFCDELASTCKVLEGYANRLELGAAAVRARTLATHWKEQAERLRDLFPLQSSVEAVDGINKASGSISDLVAQLSSKIESLPEPTKQDEARESLIVIQDRFESYGDCSRKLQVAGRRLSVAIDVYETFVNVTEEELASTYASVETRFSELYSAINSEDEGSFTAKLTPTAGSLDLQVDFYGRGYFPPGALHSEGHQDSMGICLYLALMERVQGKGFLFAVLDDVLMSVDKGHRREISKLLKSQFAETQFVLTTHDDVWLRHMRTEGLIAGKSVAHFRRWSVDTGPTYWDRDDVWSEIDDLLSQGSISQAAAALRRYLEHFSHESCSRLRATVEFRGDGQFTLGDLLPRAAGSLRDIYRKGKVATQSWGQDISQLNSCEGALAAAATLSNVDQWQMNAAVHYNSWASLVREDFLPVVSAFRDLIRQFSCEACGGMFYVSPAHGSPELLRCSCQKTSVNLVAKKAA
jgi:hypothetical protein